MKTSNSQMEMLIEFMETNGDISFTTNKALGHMFIKKKWAELERMLNSDGTGATRDIATWRRVWSDLKNNTKKKYAKVNAVLKRKTGGGPRAPKITDQDRRVMSILGEVAATGMPVAEIGFNQEPDENDTSPDQEPFVVIEMADDEAGPSVELPIDYMFEDTTEAAREPAPVPLPVTPLPHPTPHHPDSTAWKPPAKKRKLLTSVTKAETASRAFLEAQERDREYERERDIRFEALERERIRQRDVELELQNQWLVLMREFMNVVNKFLEEKR